MLQEAPQEVVDGPETAASGATMCRLMCRFGNLTVTGLVFFGPGRMERQRIVQCYIERNLVSNGGLLSEVIWQIQETAPPQDVAFLQVLLWDLRSLCCKPKPWSPGLILLQVLLWDLRALEL